MQKSNSLASIDPKPPIRREIRTKTWCESYNGREQRTKINIFEAFEGKHHEARMCHKSPTLVSSGLQSTRHTQISCIDFFSSREKNKLYKFCTSQNCKKDSPMKPQVILPFLNDKFKRNHPIYITKSMHIKIPILPAIDKIITECNSARYITAKLKHDIDASTKMIQRDFNIISTLNLDNY